MDKAPLSTDGIDINNWEIPFSSMSAELSDKYMQDNWSNKPVTFSVWDFAGMSIFFLFICNLNYLNNFLPNRSGSVL